jgi:hypothetical protein
MICHPRTRKDRRGPRHPRGSQTPTSSDTHDPPRVQTPTIPRVQTGVPGSRHPHSGGSRGVPDAHTPSNWLQLEFPSPNGGCLAAQEAERAELEGEPQAVGGRACLGDLPAIRAGESEVGLDVAGDDLRGKAVEPLAFRVAEEPDGHGRLLPGNGRPGILANEGLRESSTDAITTTPKPGFSILEIFSRNRFLGIVRVR